MEIIGDKSHERCKVEGAKMNTRHSAHDIASDPTLYNMVWAIGKYKMECIGYSKTGNTVRFGDIVPAGEKMRIVIRYINPDELLTPAAKVQS